MPRQEIYGRTNIFKHDGCPRLVGSTAGRMCLPRILACGGRLPTVWASRQSSYRMGYPVKRRFLAPNRLRIHWCGEPRSRPVLALTKPAHL